MGFRRGAGSCEVLEIPLDNVILLYIVGHKVFYVFPHLCRAVALHRWVFDEAQVLSKFLKIPRLMMYFFRRYLMKCARGHGIGRHSMEEIMEIFEDDLHALSVFLGNYLAPSNILMPLEWNSGHLVLSCLLLCDSVANTLTLDVTLEP